MKDIGVVSWKLPPHEMSSNIFAKFSPSENNVYSISSKYPAVVAV